MPVSPCGVPPQVLVKEVEGPVEHPLNLGMRALGLHELRVASKLVKPKGKPGRKKKAVLEDIAEEDAAEGGAPDPAGEPQ